MLLRWLFFTADCHYSNLISSSRHRHDYGPPTTDPTANRDTAFKRLPTACWIGIIPGKTTIAEARERVKAGL